MTFSVRKAVARDIPRLREVIEASVRGLQAKIILRRRSKARCKACTGSTAKLTADGTYFVAEVPEAVGKQIVACGGWSKRKTLYGGDQYASREDSLLDPARDAAKVRAFFVHPRWARQGIGSLILDACEQAAIASRLHSAGDGRHFERRGLLSGKGICRG